MIGRFLASACASGAVLIASQAVIADSGCGPRLLQRLRHRSGCRAPRQIVQFCCTTGRSLNELRSVPAGSGRTCLRSDADGLSGRSEGYRSRPRRDRDDESGPVRDLPEDGDATGVSHDVRSRHRSRAENRDDDRYTGRVPQNVAVRVQRPVTTQCQCVQTGVGGLSTYSAGAPVTQMVETVENRQVWADQQHTFQAPVTNYVTQYQARQVLDYQPTMQTMQVPVTVQVPVQLTRKEQVVTYEYVPMQVPVTR